MYKPGKSEFGGMRRLHGGVRFVANVGPHQLASRLTFTSIRRRHRLTVRRPSDVRSWSADLKAEGRARKLRVRVARALFAALQRRRAGRDRATVALLETDVARRREAMALCRDDRTDLGAPRRVAHVPRRSAPNVGVGAVVAAASI